MKPAYIISAYKRPDLLIRLVQSLGMSPIAIHIDKKSEIFDCLKLKLESYPNVTLLPRHVCYWGLFGHVAASIEGLKWFSDTSCDYAILLTGQCYPLKSNKNIEVELAGLNGRSVIELEKFPKSEWQNDDGGFKRLNRFYFSSDHPLYEKFRIFDFVSNKVGTDEVLSRVRSVRLWNRQPPQKLHPYGGSGYWCLSRKCTNYVVEYIKDHPELVRFFSTTFVPDEMFFQTILANSPLKNELINSKMHYMDWSTRKSNPAVLDEGNILAAIESGAWFARKFEDIEVLDKIDRLRENELSSVKGGSQ